MGKKKLSKKTILLWRWRITLSAILISFLLGALYFFFPHLAIIFVIIFCTAYIFLILVYFPLLYKNSYYSIIDNYITIEKGIILKRFIKISISKIQYVEIVTYPLQRLFKLNTLVLHTAGSQQIISPLDTIESIKIKQIIEGTYEKT